MTDYQKYKLIILSVFCFSFLIILNNYSRNGKYIFREQSYTILDTRTGTIYAPSSKKYLELDEYTEKK